MSERAGAEQRIAGRYVLETVLGRGGMGTVWFTWVRNDKLTHARVVAFKTPSHTYSVLDRSNDVFWLGGGSAEFPQGSEEAFTPLG